jgi:hypothetical protein
MNLSNRQTRPFDATDFHVVLICKAGGYHMVSWPIAICSPDMVVLEMGCGLLPILTYRLPGKGLLPFVTLAGLERFKQLVREDHVPTFNPMLGSSDEALREWLGDIDAFAAELLAADDVNSIEQPN